jgi:N,N'-diacetylchitobiose transport system permease protein
VQTTLTAPESTKGGEPPGSLPFGAGHDRRPKSGASHQARLLPFLLLIPALAVLGLMLGYPLFRLVTMSFQEFGLRQQFGTPAPWIGLANFREILGDSYFWTVLVRTLVFCFVNVALTMVIGGILALLLTKLSDSVRVLLSIGLMLAWATPPLAAVVIWQWIFDTQYGLANWALGRQGESWLGEPLSFFMVASIIVVWMGVPFVTFTLYAGLTQVPRELIEAAALDGASPVQRLRAVAYPMLKPIIMILIALSVLWDFRVFTQIYVLQKAGGISRETNLLGVYAYQISIGQNQFGVGAAIAIVMVLFTLVLTIFYLRSMTATEEL